MLPTDSLGKAVDKTPELRYTTVGEGKERLQDNGAAGSASSSLIRSLRRESLDTSSISANTEGATAFLLKTQGPFASLGKELKTGLPAFGLAKPAVIINGYTFLNGKYLLDILYNNYLISGGLKLGYTISKLLDKGIIELIGPYGLTEGSYTASASINKLDTGVITTYALYITLGLISILFILFSPLFYNALNTAAPQAELLSTITLEQMQTNYTFSLKIVLLSIFSIYISAPSAK
jgi:hypothetical protein